MTLFRERRIIIQTQVKGREAEDPKGDSPGDGWRKLRGVLLFCLFTTMIPESKEAFGEAYPCREEKAKELEKP